MATLSEAIRKSVPRVMRVTNSGDTESPESSSLHDALRLKEEIIGARMLEQTYEDLERDTELKRIRRDAELAEARAKELEATVKLEETKAKASGNGQSSTTASPLMVMLSNLIDVIQGHNQALTQELKETREGSLQQAISTLKDEISSLKNQALMQGATHTKADDVEGFLGRIEDVRKVMEMLKGFSPSSPEIQGVQGDFQTLMMFRRMNDDLMLRLEEIKDRREQVQWDRSMERERLTLEERRSQRMAGTLERYAPVISGLLYDKLGVPQSEQMSPAMQEALCPSCSGPLTMSDDRSVAFCPKCSQTYRVTSGDSGNRDSQGTDG